MFGTGLALLLALVGFALGCLAGALAPATARVAGVGGPLVLAPVEAGLRLPVAAAAPARDDPAPEDPWAFSVAPVDGGWISSRYGRRADPFTGRPALHRGLDFAGKARSRVVAAAPGIVTWSGRRAGYGNFIEIDHGDGWVTRYGHNASNLVAAGDYVLPGQTIALMGATGRATGTHLHFEILHGGRHQDPARLLPEVG